MPTARELLEQADALMRRNRTDQVDDIPVLTDAVPSIAEAPARMVAAAAAAVAEPSSRVSAARSPPSGARDAPGHEGEPSDWLEIEDAEPSVIGDAPDSVAIVPAVHLRRDVDEALLQSAEHEEIELTSAEDDRFTADAAPPAIEEVGQWSATDAVLPAGEAGAASAANSLAALSDDGRGIEIGAMAESVEVAPVADAAAQKTEVGIGALDEAAPAPPEPLSVPTAAPSAAALAASFAATMPAGVVAPAPLGPDTRWPATTESMRETVPPEDIGRASAVQAAPLGPDDQAHWDSVAEEIRMQVLQRIDLFTDTGLREQLGERLKPIVDRASADLVATINQHVGDLLRAYVAKTIEREIERWRQDN